MEDCPPEKSLRCGKELPLPSRKHPSSSTLGGRDNVGKPNPPKNGFNVTPIGPTGQKNIQVIANEAAVCKVCRMGLKVGRAIKSECTCTNNAFAHENCADKWSGRRQGTICGNGNCKGTIQNILVDLTALK